MNKKAIVIVLDSVGIGELPDAANYGDKGADTLGHIINTCHPKLPHLMELGLANIDGASFPGRVDAPKGCFGKLREVSAGKDTTTGHWEIAGVQLAQAFPTFPNGFPQYFIERFEKAVGRGTLGNKPASGTAILDELGEELAGKATVAKVNVDDNKAIASQFRVMSIPTVIFFVDGVEKERLIGVQPKQKYIDTLNNL